MSDIKVLLAVQESLSMTGLAPSPRAVQRLTTYREYLLRQKAYIDERLALCDKLLSTTKERHT